MSEEMMEKVVSAKPKEEKEEVKKKTTRKVARASLKKDDDQVKTTAIRKRKSSKKVEIPETDQSEEAVKKVVLKTNKKTSPKTVKESENEVEAPKKRKSRVSKKKIEKESEEEVLEKPKKRTATVRKSRKKITPVEKEVKSEENISLSQDNLVEKVDLTKVKDPLVVKNTSTEENSEKENLSKKEEKKVNNTLNSNNNSNRNNNNKNNRNNYQKNNRNNNRNKKRREERIEEVNIDEHPEAPRLFLNDFYDKSNDVIRQKGLDLGLKSENIYDYQRQEIITELLKDHTLKGGVLIAKGILEVLPDGYGFLRSSLNSYISGPNDIYVSANIIRHGALKTGDLVEGQVKTPRDSERFYGLHRVLLIDNEEPIKAKKRPNFDDLIPIFPDEKLILETANEDDVSTKIIDLFCPIGKGQRSLIVAPPRTGKTILLQKIANSISINYPEISLIVLLVDERPEEVTDMRDQVKGEVIASTFDEQAIRHVQVAEMAIEKAKRMVEHNKDVVILLDSITRLARAYNQTVPASGKVLSGGVDSNALHKPKRFFGAARNIKGGGSLTIISTALIETGSRMDEVIFEEFKGTGNNEIVLDRRLSDRRIFPAINVKKSGTRRDDLLLSEFEESRIWVVRNVISDMDEVDQTPFLIDKMSKAKNNEAFLKSINTAINNR